MCRIAGIYNPASASLETDILRMRDSMHRGGPDDAGIFVHPELPLALGHRRLSFLDLSPAGHQPMRTPDNRLNVIFNGEIYNFRDLKKELESLGYQFRTQSDTEVILYSYQQWGKDCFSRFNGMFALAIWDEQEKEIVLARDHAGIKPLYYHVSGEVLFFASEIRGFKAIYPNWETEDVWKPLFLLFGHIPEPFTTLKGVESIPKGSWMSVRFNGMEIKKGVFYQDDYTPAIFDLETALEVTRELLPAAVDRHLISDAPVGLFLSGGIDSSLLTLLAAPVLKDRLTTLSIQFEESEYSEEIYQKIVVDVTRAKHSSFRVNRQHFEDALDDILLAMDQPSIDAINTYFISKYARECGLKAVLSGLGADELFGGYPSFNRFKQWRYLRYVPEFIADRIGKSSNPKLSRLSYERYHPMLSLYLMNRGLYTVSRAAELTGLSAQAIETALEKIHVPPHVDYRSINANAAMESDLYMKNQLLKDADYMAMWHGIEIRVPFLDKELLQAMNSVATIVKFRSDIPKSLLIEAFSTLLPAEIWHRKKQGFTFPLAYWLKMSDRLRPVGKAEEKVFDQFNSGHLHWSRYWALKVSGIEKFI